ncbi:MAG: SsrA-binding protein SmpB [Trueperaceae bacterium]
MLQNRRARHDYEILETFEAGLVLRGSEVKSLRGSGGSIAEAYAKIEGGEVWLEGATIPSYPQASYNDHEPLRRRKLLLHGRQIAELRRGLERKGLTVVPLELYFDARGRAKLKIALARGRKRHDKRAAASERDAKREMDRALKGASR